MKKCVITNIVPMKLTEHFSLSEFEHSITAQRMGIDNAAPEAVVPAIRNLCRQVLEPLRQHVGEPVTINSGYRCPRLNGLVGGVGNSQHLRGEAADIPYRKGWMEWIMEYTDFDQLILETSQGAKWIHVSCRLDSKANRHRVVKGGTGKR